MHTEEKKLASGPRTASWTTGDPLPGALRFRLAKSLLSGCACIVAGFAQASQIGAVKAQIRAFIDCLNVIDNVSRPQSALLEAEAAERFSLQMHGPHLLPGTIIATLAGTATEAVGDARGRLDGHATRLLIARW